MLTSTYHAITPTPARPCRMNCHDADYLDRPPATWEHRWRTETMPASAFEDLCERCASELRRREVDGELREIGARVIRVEDLGPALEANEQGRHAAFVAGLAMEGRAGLLYLPKTRPIVAVFPSYVYEVAKEAARLARLALGEG